MASHRSLQPSVYLAKRSSDAQERRDEAAVFVVSSKTFVDAEYFDRLNCRLQVSLPAEPADSCGVLYIEDSERSLTLPPLTSQSLENQSNEVLEVPSLTSATPSR